MTMAAREGIPLQLHVELESTYRDLSEMAAR